jgi:hypothetical protein
MALIPQLVARERLPNAIALGSIPWQAGRMIGPSITGILIAAFGGAIGFGLAAAASYIALGLYSRLQLTRDAPAHDGRHVLRQFAEGLAFVAHSFVFTSLIALALFNSLFAMSYLTLLPVFADQYFGAGSAGYGWLSAAHGGGALCATFTVATIAHLIRRKGVALLIGATCLGLVLMGFSQAPAMSVALRPRARRLLQHVLPDAGQHVSPAEGRPPSRPGDEPYALLEPLALGMIAGALAAAVSARFAVLLGGGVVAANAALLLTSRRLRRIG